jgi:hypothetical protein
MACGLEQVRDNSKPEGRSKNRRVELARLK